MYKNALVTGGVIVALLGTGFLLNRAYTTDVLMPQYTVSSMDSVKNLIQFQREISLLDLKNPESVIKAKELYFKYFSIKDSQSFKDKAFGIFRDYYLRIANSIDADKTINGKNIKKQTDFYKSKGLKLKSEDGQYYVSTDPEFMIKEFSGYLSKMWLKCLELESIEAKQDFAKEGAAIPWADIRTRIISWDNFLKKYPMFYEKHKIESKIQEYLPFYFSDKTNISLSDYNSKKIKPEIIKSYEKFLSKNKLQSIK